MRKHPPSQLQSVESTVQGQKAHLGTLLDILVLVWLRHLPCEVPCKGQGFTPWYWGIFPNQGLICAWEGIKWHWGLYLTPPPTSSSGRKAP